MVIERHRADSGGAAACASVYRMDDRRHIRLLHGLFLMSPMGLGGCGARAGGDWLGVCGEHLRLQLAVRTGEEEVATGSGWLIARPDDVLDFRCDVGATRTSLELSTCAGGWLTDGGVRGALDQRLDAAVERGDRADTLEGNCTWDGEDGAASLLRIREEPDQEDTGAAP
jgi:hypothetical protein